MKYTLLPCLVALGLGYSAGGLADKPTWAGDGGRPTTEEKQPDKDRDQDRDQDREQDREQDRDKDQDGG